MDAFYPPSGAWWQHTHPWSIEARPEIVTLCGSTQFVDLFNEWRQRFTLRGMIVLSIEIVTTQTADKDPQRAEPQVKKMLDLLHFEKIKMSDFIFVINYNGYIGYSTRREIDYALELGKPIEYLEPPAALSEK